MKVRGQFHQSYMTSWSYRPQLTHSRPRVYDGPNPHFPIDAYSSSVEYDSHNHEHTSKEWDFCHAKRTVQVVGRRIMHRIVTWCFDMTTSEDLSTMQDFLSTRAAGNDRIWDCKPAHHPGLNPKTLCWKQPWLNLQCPPAWTPQDYTTRRLELR